MILDKSMILARVIWLINLQGNQHLRAGLSTVRSQNSQVIEIHCSALSIQGVFNQGELCKINMAAPHLDNNQRKYSAAHQKQEK